MAAGAPGIGDDVHVRTWPSPRVISRRPARLIAPSWGRGDVRRPEHTGSLIGSPPLLGQRGKPARVQPGPAQRLRTDRLVARVDFTGGGADAVVGVSPPVPVGTAMAAQARGGPAPLIRAFSPPNSMPSGPCASTTSRACRDGAAHSWMRMSTRPTARR